MREVRNSDGSLVAIIEEAIGTIVIIRKGCETRLSLREDGKIEIYNTKNSQVCNNHK